MWVRTISVVAFLVAGCDLITPYKMDVQQGNVVTQVMLARLQPGMTRSQVRFALGTPLIVDPFHNDRWDYVYHMSKQGEVVEQRRVVVVFKDDRLLRIEGEGAPTPKAGAAPEEAKVAPPPAREVYEPPPE